MKILSINTFNRNTGAGLYAPHFKGNDTSDRSKEHLQGHKQEVPKNSKARDFHAIKYAIKTPSYVKIKLRDRTDTLLVSSATTAKYLTTKGKKADKALLEKFGEIYTKNLQDRLDLEDETCKFYTQTIKENARLRQEPNADIERLNSSSATATLLLSSTNERVQIAKKQAYEETELFFEIAKTNKGYDFSRQEEKREIAGLLHTLQLNAHHTGNFPLELKSAAKDKSGNFDVDFAKLICAFIKDQDFPASPLYIAEKIRYFTQKDPKNAAKIIDTMLKINRSDYQLDSNDPAFENLMEVCFTEYGDFIQDAPETILKLINYSDNLLDYWIEADIIDESDILYYLDLSKTIILGFMENIIDGDGSVNESEIPDEKDFQNIIEELFEN